MHSAQRSWWNNGIPVHFAVALLFFPFPDKNVAHLPSFYWYPPSLLSCANFLTLLMTLKRGRVSCKQAKVPGGEYPETQSLVSGTTTSRHPSLCLTGVLLPLFLSVQDICPNENFQECNQSNISYLTRYMEYSKGEDEEFSTRRVRIRSWVMWCQPFRSRVTSKGCSRICRNEDAMKMGEGKEWVTRLSFVTLTQSVTSKHLPRHYPVKRRHSDVEMFSRLL